MKRGGDQKTAKKSWWPKTSPKMTFKNPAKSPIFSRRIIPARIQRFRPARYVLFLPVSRLYPQLSSWSFVENLKRYAREAGIGKIHLHQTRHTFARMVAKRSGSLSETQDALGHRHASTTRIYVDSIAIKTDKYSQHILEALELPDFEIDLD